MTDPLRADEAQLTRTEAREAARMKAESDRKIARASLIAKKIALKDVDEKLNGKSVSSPDLHERLTRKSKVLDQDRAYGMAKPRLTARDVARRKLADS